MQRRMLCGIFSSLVLFFLLSPSLCAQTADDDSYRAERAQAVKLFKADKHLDALPLFEDLAKRNPEDADVLAGLGACLIDKSATMEDQDAATKERARARDLLVKAQKLGNNTTLLQNLLQLTPENGVVHYENSPAGQAMRQGESAFARHDFDEAIKDYSKVLESDPKNYSAALFIGDSYFAGKDFGRAGEWYEKAVKIDPNRETAYRYHADMLTRSGDMEGARTKAIQAVVAEPYNPITWRGLQEWAKANKLQLNRVRINTPAAPSSSSDGQMNLTLDSSQSPENMAIWLVYSGTQISWHKEEFSKHFPNEKAYRRSLPEESAALSAAASMIGNLGDKKKKKSELPKDPDLALLLKLKVANMIEPYVLLSAPDEGISHDYESYRQQNRAKLEQYLAEFVVPAVSK